jgi:hypothetical protein
MQAEKVIGLINKQVPFSNKSLLDLEEMLEEYPYFQAARILYVLNLQENKDTNVLTEIRKAACYMGDRKKFFYLVEKDFSVFSLVEATKRKEQQDITASFDLVDIFLEKKENKTDKRMILHTHESQPVANDYISYFLSEKTQGQSSNPMPLKYQDAIDKFISEDEKAGVKIVPNEKQGKNEVSPISEIDKEEEGSVFFSETLAKVYLKQRKYERALKIIRELSLVYPEKSIYFADQIRFLEKLVINKK